MFSYLESQYKYARAHKKSFHCLFVIYTVVLFTLVSHGIIYGRLLVDYRWSRSRLHQSRKAPGSLRQLDPILFPIAAPDSNALNHRRIYEALREFRTHASAGGQYVRSRIRFDRVATYYATQHSQLIPLSYVITNVHISAINDRFEIGYQNQGCRFLNSVLCRIKDWS